MKYIINKSNTWDNMDLTCYLNNFFDYIFDNNIDIYNEFSFQHELGIFLRDNLPNDYKVQFERNVKFFDKNMINFKPADFVKKEIDIVIYKCAGDNVESCHAIELKYPRNGQYPDSMYAFVKDIKFTEQLKSAGFDNTYCMVMVDDERFYSDRLKTDGIYQYFRGDQPIQGKIYQHTGEGKYKNYYAIDGEYTINWVSIGEKGKMYLIETNLINTHHL